MPPLVLLLVLLLFRAASDVAVLLLCHFNIFHTDTSAAAKDVGGIVDISQELSRSGCLSFRRWIFVDILQPDNGLVVGICKQRTS